MTAPVPLPRQATRRAEIAAAEEAIRERFRLSRRDRRAFARLLRKAA